MLNHVIFILYLIIFLLSNIGYGYLFGNLFYKDLKSLNYGYLGIIGFFFIIFISILSSFLSPHNYMHNLIVHSIGLLAFLLNFFINKNQNIIELKRLTLIFLVFGSGIYLFKNHDDFGYYHLTYALNLSQNGFIIGTGALGHGFRTMSSLFYYHSTLYLPFIKFYLFHSGPFFILVYFNYIVLTKLINKFKEKQIDIVYFLSLLNFIFVNIAFYRIAEHGTDRSGQILLFLIFIIFLEILFLKKTKKQKNVIFNFLLVAILLAVTTKALFIIYSIIVLIILYRDNYYKDYFIKKNLKIITVLFIGFLMNLLVNFFSTGCLLYPEEKTCFNKKFEWSIPKEEVKQMKVHYEWWAKAGGGPGYSSEIKKEDYIKNFNWFKDWVDRHFFNKVSDTLLGIILIALINVILFKGKKKTQINIKKIFIINSTLLILFVEWFLGHPSMRYGGYVLFALPIFIYTSRKIETYIISEKKLYFTSIFLILLTLIIYNVRNIKRINFEVNNYNYSLLKSPFFNVEKAPVTVMHQVNNFKIYKTVSGMCWAASTPCTHRSSLKVKNWKGFKIIVKDDK
jgi:hypothetical protein